MLRLAIFLTSLVLTLGLVACGDDDETGDGPEPTEPPATSASTPPDGETAEPTEPGAGALSLTSSVFEDNEPIPAHYTCDGDNVLPPLAISGVPEGTASLAIIVTDLDGPGGDFVHWSVWNIEPATTEIAEASVPAGAVEGATGRGSPGFFGPCPPSGEHRYVFDLYALDETLTLDATVDKAALLSAMEGQILSQTSLTALYSREEAAATP
jgi:Raf kinase inhibitor-like YbhB/YbcL family protein